MNGHLEQQIIKSSDIYLQQKLAESNNPDEQLEILWKAILGRLPNDSEKALATHPTDDLIWALLNSNEFRFNK